MNTRQLQYAIELSKCLNVSQVAEQLGISQPALSKQILSLEKELGIKLFNRNTVPLTVTPAGEYFFREAEKLLYHEDQLLKSMEEFKTGKRGQLVIGISPFRSLYLVPEIAKKVKERYPDVQILLHEATSDVLRKETAEGKYDFAIVNLPVDESALDVNPLEADTLVLAVPMEMAKGMPTKRASGLPEIQLEDCADLPFVVVGQSQEMRKLFEKSCVAANVEPHIAMEVVGISTAWAMCRAGIGATLLPMQFVNNMGNDGSIRLFALKQMVHSRQPVIITRRGQYVSEYAKYTMELFVEQARREVQYKKK